MHHVHVYSTYVRTPTDCYVGYSMQIVCVRVCAQLRIGPAYDHEDLGIGLPSAWTLHGIVLIILLYECTLVQR